jgi:hypothetical protein
VFGKENKMSDDLEQIENKTGTKEEQLEFPDDTQVEAVSDDSFEIVDASEDNETPAVEKNKQETHVQANKGIEELRLSLENERKARIEAEVRASEAYQNADQAYNEVADSHYHLIKGAMDSLQRDQEILKSNMREAFQIGDYDRAVEINEALSSNSMKLMQLENGFQQMQLQQQEAQHQQQQRQQETKKPQELTVDTLIDRVTPLSKQWLIKNKEHLGNQRSIRMMARAHEDAIDMGIIPESEDYFRHVENRLGINKIAGSHGDDGDALSAASAPTQRRSAPPAAPVSRGGGSNKNVVRLTSAQAEAAKISGLSPKEYYELWQKEQKKLN